MNDQQIQNDNDPKKYFIMLPNIADDSDLDPYEFRLYVHYSRVGNCWEGTSTTARKCNMSMGAVSKKRRSLAAKGWITLTEPEKDNPTDTIKIRVKDKWAENMQAFTPSPGETPPSPGETPPSPGETKKNNTKNNKSKNSDPSPIEELVTLFADKTNLRIPKNGNLKDNWLDPLVAIYKASSEDFETTKERVTVAIEILSEKGYSVFSPGSIQNTAVNLDIHPAQPAYEVPKGEMQMDELGQWKFVKEPT